jgi:streptogramin lyase
MLEERLRNAARALERSVVEVDAVERLQALGRRRRRQRAVTTALALAVVAAVLAGAVLAVGIARDPDPPPAVGPDPTAPARVVESLRLFGDPAGNRPTVVPVPRCCDGELAAGEGALWVANRGDGTLVRVDPGTGRVAARVPLPRTTGQRPHQVAVGDGAVWVTSAGARRGTANLLWRVDPASNQVTGTLDLGPTPAGGIPNSVAAGNGAVWLGGATKGAIVRLAPS